MTSHPARRLAVAVAVVVVGVVWFGPTTQAAKVLLLGRDWSGPALLDGAVMGVLISAMTWALSHVPDRDPVRRALRLSIQSGELPPDADPEVWRPMLDRELRRERYGRWLLPAMFGSEVALLAAVAATGQAHWSLWLAVAAAAAIAVVSSVWDVGDRRAIGDLREQVTAPR